MSHNFIHDYNCQDTTLPGPAVLLWNGVVDSVVESNTFVNCARGIAMGLINRATDHVGGHVFNNVFVHEKNSKHTQDAAIYIASKDAIVEFNSIV